MSSGNPYVNNNVWNTTEAGPETISVCALGSWYVVANQPDLASDHGSVKSYPERAGDPYTADQRYTTERHVWRCRSQEGEGMLAIITAAAFTGRDPKRHSMSIPRRSPSGSTAVTIDGVAYHALKASSTFIVLLNDTYILAGSVNILHVFNWLAQQGWVSLSDSFSMIGYGVEISVTESSPGVQGQERFDLTDWTLNAN